jgi:hypothetical protein
MIRVRRIAVMRMYETERGAHRKGRLEPQLKCLNPPEGTAENNSDVGRPDIDVFRPSMREDECYFVGFEFAADDCLKSTGSGGKKVAIKPLTVRQILDEEFQP